MTPSPLVKFTNGRTMLCVPAEFSIMNANGEMEARRDQVIGSSRLPRSGPSLIAVAIAGSLDSRVGAERTQVSGTDLGARPGRSGADI